jgi:hypothetical protein
MNPLIAIAASLFPEILKIIAGDKAGAIGSAVAKAVTDATGTSSAEDAKTKIEADPRVAADLQVKLAQIALDQRKAEAAAQAQERQAQFEAQKLQFEADQKRRQDELEGSKLSAASVSAARSAIPDYARVSRGIAWTPSVLSYIVVVSFILVLLILIFARDLDPKTEQILNICIGAITAGFATVLNFWLGSSLGSRNKDDALVRSNEASQARDIRAADEAEKKSLDDGRPAPQRTTSTGPSATLSGRMSVFGGPSDSGVAADEGLALFGPDDVDDHPELFLPQQPLGTTGLARRLNPNAHYIACRWKYAETPRAHLRAIKVTVRNPQTGRSAEAQPADWGPAESTGRVADLSPGLAAFLGLQTDQTCEVTIPLPKSPSPLAGGGSHLKVLSLAEIEAKFGKFPYSEAPGGRIEIGGTWVRDNIVEITIPELARVQAQPIQCHRLVADQLKAAFTELDRRGLIDRILKWDGMFVPRHKTWDPSRTLSSHSWGIAFDINARWNGYGNEPAPKGAMGSVVDLVPVLEAFGFAWGGYFSAGSRDGMHFECCRIGGP